MAAVLGGLWKAVFWAVLLALLARPVHIWLLPRLGGRASAAAALTVALAVLFVILPGLVVGGLIIEEAIEVHGMLARGEIDPAATVSRLQDLVPMLEDWVARIGLELREIAENLRTVAMDAGQYLLRLALVAAERSAGFVLNFFIALYLMFFFIRDADTIEATVLRARPMEPVQLRRFFDRFAVVARATVKGALAIGLVQGSLGTLIFLILGIPGAFFWGALMALLSLLPVVGPPLVWGPAAVFRLVEGDVAGAVVLIVFGTLVIGMVDNLLRPLIVGRQSRMPDALVLVSTLGGISLFGITGIVLGPLVATFFLVSWEARAEGLAARPGEP